MGSKRVQYDWATNTYLLIEVQLTSSSSWIDINSIIAAFNLTIHYANMFYNSWGALRNVWTTSQSKESLKNSIARCAMIPRIVNQEKRREMGALQNKEQRKYANSVCMHTCVCVCVCVCWGMEKAEQGFTRNHRQKCCKFNLGSYRD